ncbi:endopeptidase La [uncultured Cocleimonas sp.]|uniref:endopeptidase La n=1 Tax=uncultured Cocleimonas sp. TaxID=1051587 RepID=UPI0026289838|nr:endopeptidase La [uncultured Cocleimonas sp.]
MATEKDNKTAETEKNIKGIPVLTLRDVVVYPHMVIPLFVGREKSIRSLDEAMENNKQILLVAQKSAEVDEPGPDDIFEVGTLATILQLLKLPDGTLKVLVEGVERVKIASMDIEGEYFTADIDVIPVDDSFDKRKTELLSRALVNLFDKYVNLNKKVPPEILSSLSGIDEPDRLSDAIAAHLGLKVTDKQKILEITSVKERLEHLVSLVEGEIDLLQVEKRIRGRVKQQMDRSQREYYLNEQMKAIQKELGDLDDAPSNELEQLAEKLEKAKMPKEAKEKAEEELKKLKMMSPMSAEATVVRNYIDWMVGLPWSKKSKISKDLAKAQKVLDEDHYGLDEVKERIVEYLAVQQRVKKLKGPIMCLVGPPGVGKTSLGKSLAKATGRNYTRMALGGVRDEAEIRGHRRTYIGALPGKIIQNLSRVKTRNPLFLLDEIDKMATDFRGDPASAMLEVLDPEQNNSFADHYLEVDFDLSDVMFVATSNSMNIPGPLLDRMEIIRIPGYTEDEKLNIAKNYLVPKQYKDNGVEKGEVTISDSAILSIIRHYTREAGVRSLEREISKICRKVIREHLLGKKSKSSVTGRNISKYLGVQRFDYGKADKKNQVGQVTGLAWTSVGGELLTIESVVVSGNGHVKSTGSLGKVMQESIQAAETVVKSRSRHLGITQKFLKKKNVHIHVPEGATPKDGPSAGVGMVTAIVSSMTGIPVKAEVAMTGEITLRGEVLPIGGLKEKLLAAHRGGITTVLIPADNEKDLADVPDNVKKGLSIKPVKWIDEVLEFALESMPEAIDEEDDLEEDLEQSTQSQNNPDQEEESRAH